MVLLNLINDQISDEINIGEKLREIRNQKNFSMRVLAEKSGLSISALSLIEKGKSSPSVSTLQRLANALNVPIATFFSSETDKHQVIFTHKEHRSQMKAGKVHIEILGKDFASKRFQQYIVNFKENDGSGDSRVVHTGLESIFCLSGIVEFKVGESVFTLSAGDNLVFNSHIPHSWHTVNNNKGQMLITFYTSNELESPEGQYPGMIG